MDYADEGQAAEEASREASLKRAKVEAAKNTLVLKGECHNCETTLVGKNFCDVACRDEYEEMQRKNRIGRSR